MAYKAVLISAPQDALLSDSIMPDLRRALEKSGADVGPTNWLSRNEAADVCFSGIEIDAAKHCLNDAVGEMALDLTILPAESAAKKLLLADMDSTIIAVECIDELADFAGLKDQVSAITEAAMRGELEFDEALANRVALLKGMDIGVLERCFEERVRFNPGALTLVQTMRSRGAYCALVSGGFTFFTGRVADALGFHMHRSNELGVLSGKLTGAVVPPISNAATKLETLQRLATEKSLSTDEIIAVGDGANDIPMMEAAGLSVAYHAKPKAQAAATARVNHGDLTALLYLQGIKKADFITK